MYLYEICLLSKKYYEYGVSYRNLSLNGGNVYGMSNLDY